MSFDAMAWAVQQRTGHGIDHSVLLQLASQADEKDRCFPSHKYIAEQTEFSVSAVRAAIARLQANGFLKVEDHFIGERQTSNRYTLLRTGSGGVVTEHPVASTEQGGCSDTTTTQSENYKEQTSSARPAPRGVSHAVVEIAREAEAGTLRKSASKGRSVDAGDRGSVVAFDRTKHRPKKPPTTAQRCYGVAERFRAQAVKEFPGEAMQASTDGIYKTLRRILAESPGLTWEHLDRGREMFFADTARLHVAGVPAWKNFLRHLPELVERARRELTPDVSPEEWFAKREAKRGQAMTEEEIEAWAARRAR